MTRSARPVRVVLLGGGYVTLHAVATLRRCARRGLVSVTVLSADDRHNFHGFSGEVLAGLLPLETTRTPLREVLRHTEFRHARVTGVDLAARTVQARSHTDGRSFEVGYDQLVVGTGGIEPTASVPGLADHGFLLRRPGDLAGLLDRLAARRAENDGRPVVVVGAGLAGVELAAAIVERSLATSTHQPVELIHRGPAVLPELARQPRLVRRAAHELDRLQVRVRLSTAVVSVGPEAVVLSDGTTLPAAAVLGTNGQRPVPLAGLEELPRDADGRLVTAPDLRVRDGIWAGGDAAAVRHVRTGQPVPANALWAIKAGRHIGRGIARQAGGRAPRRFRYLGLGLGAAFGVGHGIGELYGMPLTGMVAWISRMAFFLRFVPQRRRAARTVRHLGRALVSAGFRYESATEAHLLPRIAA